LVLLLRFLHLHRAIVAKNFVVIGKPPSLDELGASILRRELKFLCASFLCFFSLHGVCFVGEEDSEDSEEGERRRR
jgi:hypothetical protein